MSQDAPISSAEPLPPPAGAAPNMMSGQHPLEVLAQVQAKLEELKQASEESARRAQELDDRERALEERVRALTHESPAGHRPVSHSQHEYDELRRSLEQREEALRVLAQRLLNAEERLVEMESSLSAAQERAATAQAEASEQIDRAQHATDGLGATTFVEQRRARLVRYKAILTAQARKVLSARTALEKRQAECEAVLAQRARLSAAAAELQAQKRAVAARAARSTAAAIMFFVIGSMAVVALTAWAVAGRISPPFFAAKTILAADPGDQPANQDDLKAWTAAHERLVEDPELIALAADRFAARGMPELATPGAVTARFKVGGDLTYMTDKAGHLTLELRGQGSERTARELETFALATVALANARRDSRGDGYPTVITEAAASGNEPIRDDRLLRMATLSLPGLLLAGGIGFGAYRLLAGSKRNFEKHMAVVEATA